MSQRIVEIEFKENKRVDALLDGHAIASDLTEKEGGDSQAPTPFALFIASLATCAAMYARGFCEKRDISTEGLQFRTVCDFDDEPFHMRTMTFEVTPPADFPEKYRKALVRSVEQCFVKKHVLTPPEFVTTIVE